MAVLGVGHLVGENRFHLLRRQVQKKHVRHEDVPQRTDQADETPVGDGKGGAPDEDASDADAGPPAERKEPAAQLAVRKRLRPPTDANPRSGQNRRPEDGRQKNRRRERMRLNGTQGVMEGIVNRHQDHERPEEDQQILADHKFQIPRQGPRRHGHRDSRPREQQGP